MSYFKRAHIYIKDVLKLYLMMHFSIKIGLKHVRVVGPELELLLGWFAGSGRCTSLQKQKQRGLTRAYSLPLRCLSQFFLDEIKYQLLKGRMFYVSFTNGVT